MERKSSALLLTCLTAWLLAFAIAQTASAWPWSKKDSEEIRKLWKEVYEDEKTPDEVYKRLESIQQIYASRKANDLSRDDQQAKETYDILFKAWNPTRDQCNEDYFSQRDHFRLHFLIDANIGNYWRQCEQKRIQVCEPVLEGKLRAEVNRIGEAKRRQVKLLVDSIIGEPPKALDEVEEKLYVAGVLKFMETLEGPLNKSVLKLWVNAEERFNDVYKRRVSDLCRVVLVTGREQMRIFTLIKLNNEEWRPPNGQLAKQWIDADQICSKILYKSFERKTFELLRETNKGKGLLGLGREV